MTGFSVFSSTASPWVLHTQIAMTFLVAGIPALWAATVLGCRWHARQRQSTVGWQVTGVTGDIDPKDPKWPTIVSSLSDLFPVDTNISVFVLRTASGRVEHRFTVTGAYTEADLVGFGERAATKLGATLQRLTPDDLAVPIDPDAVTVAQHDTTASNVDSAARTVAQWADIVDAGVTESARPAGVYVEGVGIGVRRARANGVILKRGAERDRLVAFLAWLEQARAGVVNASRVQAGTATQQLTGSSMWCGTVVGFGPNSDPSMVLASMPGAVAETTTERVKDRVAGRIVMASLGAVVTIWGSPAGRLWDTVGPIGAAVGYVAAIIVGRIVGSGAASRWMIARSAARGTVWAPPFLRGFPFWQTAGLLRARTRDADPTRSETPGAGKSRVAYPWSDRTTVFSGWHFMELLLPPRGRVDGERVAQTRAIPSVALVPGAVLGRLDDQVVRVDYQERWQGVSVVGDPGSGKSTALLGLFASDCAARVFGDDGQNGTPRRQIVPFWLEPKSDGDARAARILARIGVDTPDGFRGYKPNVDGPNGFWHVRLGDPASPRVAWLRDGDASDVNRFVNAMMFAFPDGSLRGRAATLAKRALFVAVCVPPDLRAVYASGGVWNPVRFAARLLGDSGQIAGELGARAQSAGGPFGAAVSQWDQERAGVSKGQWAENSRPPRQRLEELLEAGWVFDEPGDGRCVSFEQMLRDGRPVLFSTVVPSNTTLAGLFSRISLFLLWQAIQEVCPAWGEEGRAVSFFCDEAAMIAGHGDATVLDTMRAQGRSFGVWLSLGAQWLTQLSGDVATAFSSAGVRVVFSTSEDQAVQQAAGGFLNPGVDLRQAGHGEYGGSDVLALDAHWGIGRVRNQTRLSSAFLFKTVNDPDWDRRLMCGNGGQR